MDIEKIKETPIADFLSRLGFHPVKKRGAVLWYHAPYRGDKSPSFKLDTRKEKWFDFGMDEGGDIFTLAGKLIPSNDFIRQAQYIAETMKLPMPEVKGTEYLKDLPDEEPQFSNVEVLPLGHYALRQYLAERAIPFEVAARYCKEVHYDLRNKRYFAIGFPNDKGGYEVRNKFFKGCIAPKGTTFIRCGEQPSRGCNVFEGFFDFLSAVALGRAEGMDSLVLNSIIYLRKSTDLLSQYRHVHAYLDNDDAGKKAVQTLKDSLGEKVIDHTADYSGSKDLNEFLVKNQQNINNNQKTTNNESNINNEEGNQEDCGAGLHGSRRVLHRCLR